MTQSGSIGYENPPIASKREKRIYVCQSGLPLSFHLEWPFHKSTSGADFWVLHAECSGERARLACSGIGEPFRDGLEVMPSLEPKDIEAPVINALRKEVDRKQIEFLKSGKRVPCSSPAAITISNEASGCLERLPTKTLR